MDFQVKKLTNISERFSIETQFMFLNIFNHTQFGGTDPLDINNPSVVVPGSGWGDISNQVNDPRATEFGIRLNF
jgi:hypothetical protein